VSVAFSGVAFVFACSVVFSVNAFASLLIELVRSNVESVRVHITQRSINNEANALNENKTEQDNTQATPEKATDTADAHTNTVSENVSTQTADEEITQISEQPSTQSANSETKKQAAEVNSADKTDDQIEQDTHKETSEAEQQTDHNKETASA